MFSSNRHLRLLGCVFILVGLGGVVGLEEKNVNSAMAQEPVLESIADDANEAAELGVEVTDSPGPGVLVQVVAIGSPADFAGINPGDFILAVDGDPIETPSDLVKTIKNRSPGTDVTVGLWRNGNEIDQRVVLATSHAPLQPAERAWLGVTLQSDGTAGAEIRQVIIESPADRAKLVAGDVIVAVNETTIASAKELVDAIENYQPGETIALELKGDKPRRVDVKLGAIADAPPIFSFRVPMEEYEWTAPDSIFPDDDSRAIPQRERRRWLDRFELQKQLSDMQQQIQRLSRQLDQLRSSKSDDDDDDDPDDDEEDDDDDNDKRNSRTTLNQIPSDAANQALFSPPNQVVENQTDRDRDRNRDGDRDGSGSSERDQSRYEKRYEYRYQNRYRPPAYYRYRYRTPPVVVNPPLLPTSPYYFYGPRQFYRPYYRPGVRVYVGPRGMRYYYR